MKRIVQICLIMTGIFWGVFNVYGSSTYQILKDQQIEFTDILVEGDSLVLVRNEKNGFSSEGIYLGVYNCVERMWTVEYQAYDEYLESSYYAGDVAMIVVKYLKMVHILLLIDRGMSMEIIQNVLCLIAMVIK